MENYKHILVAVDFSDHGDTVMQRAKDLADKYHAKLSVIHVVDNLPITDAAYGPVISFEFDVTEVLMKAAKQRMADLGNKFLVSSENQRVEMGSPKIEVVAVAEEKGVDLIVVGSHGRHGLALLLGSTANGVLHYAKCDVIAVRLQDD